LAKKKKRHSKIRRSRIKEKDSVRNGKPLREVTDVSLGKECHKAYNNADNTLGGGKAVNAFSIIGSGEKKKKEGNFRGGERKRRKGRKIWLLLDSRKRRGDPGWLSESWKC